MEGNGARIAEPRDSTASTALIQGVQNLQISGGIFTLAGRDVHYHTHYHGTTISEIQSALESIPNFRAIHIATLGRATPGTCLWIFEWESFLIWLDPEGFLRIMWGSGMPGAGKTILASIVISALEDRAKVATSPICVCYVYIRYSDSAKASVRDFLEILVKQVVERHPNCIPLFEEVYERHVREKSQPAEEELFGLLAKFTTLMAATFFILDALDEAPVVIQLDLVRKLVSLNAKLFITSRPLKTVEAHFPSAYSFSIQAQAQDIDLHIAKEISRSPELSAILEKADASFRRDIVSSIKQKCGGMFLHASLQLDAIRECTSISDVKETLDDFPARIEGVYIHTWNRLIHQTPKKVLLAETILLWVLTATRSLTVTELRQAVAASPDTYKFDRNRMVPEETLVGVCCGLVAVEAESGLVRLVHYTAQDTLKHLILQTFPHPHSLLASVCMVLLADCYFQRGLFLVDSERTLEEALETEPLLSYAYQSWATHAGESLVVPSTANHVGEFVRGCHSFPVLLYGTRWFEVLGPFHVAAFYNLPITLAGAITMQSLNHPTKDVGATPLYLACLQDSQISASGLLNRPEILVNAATKRGRTPLIEAARCNGAHNVRLLLNHPQTNVNLDDEDGWTALAFASESGSEKAVELLLDHPQTSVNLADHRGRTPLMMASLHNREGTVKLLLSHPETSVNLRDKDGWTALIFALRMKGCEGTARLLLCHPQIDATLADNVGRSPLIGASLSGNETAVQLLASHPRVNVNQTDKEGRTALFFAARGGFGGTVKVLLAHPQININMADNSNKWTPLMAAVTRAETGEDHERTYAVKLLLDCPQVDVTGVDAQGRTALILAVQKGATASSVQLLLNHPEVDVNAVDGDGATAVIWASRHGRANLVQLLLAHPKTNVNCQDSMGRTALIWAAGNGHNIVVEYLLDHPRTDFSVVDSEGHTPLKWASRNGQTATVQLLLSHSRSKLA